MKITKVEVFLLHAKFVYVKVDTDEGISGWGEAAFHGERLTAQVLETLRQQVVGLNSLNKVPLEVVEGHIVVPNGPRLGIEINEEMIREIA